MTPAKLEEIKLEKEDTNSTNVNFNSKEGEIKGKSIERSYKHESGKKSHKKKDYRKSRSRSYNRKKKYY
jgi:hypothetical protein